MVIYGNNLHEKLAGIAFSKEYIKYATPYCDFVDDPDLSSDIDLAVNFTRAENGDADAAATFTETLILSGYLFDWSTKLYYKDKMISNRKVWGPQIDRVKYAFETGKGFGNAFDEALKDCLNSPCNLFAQNSDSIGRMAQVASTKNGSNAFGVASLSATFVNTTNGIDEAITKKLPSIFSDAVTEITQSVSNARANIQEIAAGKKNLKELTQLAADSGSMRGTKNLYRYTPDLKSFTDFNNLGYNILLKVKEKMGGCFDKYQHTYRYNPFTDNTSVPANVTTLQYNGTPYEVSPNGVTSAIPPRLDNLNTGPRTLPTVKGNEKVGGVGGRYISDGVMLDGITGKGSNYSVFGASIIKGDGKYNIIIDDFGATAADIDTLNGRGLNGGQIRICPSYPLAGTKSVNVDAVLRSLQQELEDGDGFLNKFSQRYVSMDMTTLYTPHYGEDNLGVYLNEGVAISEKLLVQLTGKTFKGFGFGDLARKNQIWVAARRQSNPGGMWQFYKIVDANTQDKLNVDFTPAAYYDLFKKLPKGREAGIYKNYKKIFDTANVEINIGAHVDTEAVEFRIVTGNLDDLAEIRNKLIELTLGI